MDQEKGITPCVAEAILGCKINCYHYGGLNLGCEYYTDDEKVEIVKKGIESGKVFTCPDGIIEVSIRDAQSMINQ